jgi:hypothetical protein
MHSARSWASRAEHRAILCGTDGALVAHVHENDDVLRSGWVFRRVVGGRLGVMTVGPGDDFELTWMRCEL